MSTFNRSNAMRRARSSSTSRTEPEWLPKLDMSQDTIGTGEGRGGDGVREDSEVSTRVWIGDELGFVGDAARSVVGPADVADMPGRDRATPYPPYILGWI